MKAKYFYNRIFKTRNCQVNFFRKDILEDFKLVRLKKQKKVQKRRQELHLYLLTLLRGINPIWDGVENIRKVVGRGGFATTPF